jgi:hypothetical protein
MDISVSSSIFLCLYYERRAPNQDYSLNKLLLAGALKYIFPEWE